MITVPDIRIGRVNVVFVWKKMSCVRVVSVGGEGKRKGRKAVDFEQATWVDGKFAIMEEGLHSQESGFPILLNRKKRSHLKHVCVFKWKEFSGQVKNIPNVKIQKMHLFSVQKSW